MITDLQQAINHLKYGKRGDFLYFDKSKVKLVRISNGINTLPDIRVYRERLGDWVDIEWADACEGIESLLDRELSFD